MVDITAVSSLILSLRGTTPVVLLAQSLFYKNQVVGNSIYGTSIKISWYTEESIICD